MPRFYSKNISWSALYLSIGISIIAVVTLVYIILLLPTTPSPHQTHATIHNNVSSTQNTVTNIPIPTSTSLSLLAVGDMMLDRSVWLNTKKQGDYNYPFLMTDSLFSNYDIRLGNLEGPITTNQSIANGTGGARFTFTFSPEFVEPLKKRFTVLSLANNHTHNFGERGLEQTKEFLQDAQILYFGDPNNTEGMLSTTTSLHNITIGFVGFHELVNHGFDQVVSETARLAPLVDYLIVMPHWGVEYITDRPTTVQQQEAHALIDAGADVVIGAHPHVIQPIELYNNKLIFYSLGNFIFDQYFSEETMQGLTVGIHIEKTNTHINTNYSLIPIRISPSSQAYVADADYAKKVLSTLSEVSIGESIQPNIASGTLFTSWEISD